MVNNTKNELLEKLFEELHALTSQFNADIKEDLQPWESGNFNDCYNSGIEFGMNEVYKELLGIVMRYHMSQPDYSYCYPKLIQEILL